MANPQKENGYAPISNEIMEALSQGRMNPSAWQVLIAIFRKTYGFNKKKDRLSVSQLAELTKLGERQTKRALAWLKAHNIVIRDAGGLTSFNKDYESWKLSTGEGGDKIVTVTTWVKGGDKTRSKGVTDLSPTKDTTKAIDKRQGNAVEKIGDKRGKRPYLKGDPAWQDPNDPSHWRVQGASGWVEYNDVVKGNLEWR